MSARLDTSTRRVRRAGKLGLRKLNLVREKEGLGSVTKSPSAVYKPQKSYQEGAMLAPKSKEKRVAGEDTGISSDMVGLVRPVSFAPRVPEAQREVAEQMDGVVEEEKMAWQG